MATLQTQRTLSSLWSTLLKEFNPPVSMTGARLRGSMKRLWIRPWNASARAPRSPDRPWIHLIEPSPCHRNSNACAPSRRSMASAQFFPRFSVVENHKRSASLSNGVTFLFTSFLTGYLFLTSQAVAQTNNVCLLSLHSESSAVSPGEFENLVQELMKLLQPQFQEPSNLQPNVQRHSQTADQAPQDFHRLKAIDSQWNPLIAEHLVRQAHLQLTQKYGKEFSQRLLQEAQTRLLHRSSEIARPPKSKVSSSVHVLADTSMILNPKSVFIYRDVSEGKFSPGQNKILLLSMPASMKIVNWPTLSTDQPSPQNDQLNFASSFVKNGKVFATGEGLQGLPNAQKSKKGETLITFFEFHRRFLRSIDFSADGSKLVGASGDYIHAWDTRTGQFLGELHPNLGVVVSLKYSQQKDWLALSSYQQPTQIWDLGEQRQINDLDEGNLANPVIAFSTDGRFLASASSKGVVRILDSERGTLVGELEDPNSSINALVYSHSGHMIITVSGDGYIRFFNAKTGQLLLRKEGLAKNLKSIAISPDDHWLLIGDTDPRPATRLWQLYSRTYPEL